MGRQAEHRQLVRGNLSFTAPVVHLYVEASTEQEAHGLQVTPRAPTLRHAVDPRSAHQG
ncbi:hypothetical protein GCM10017782_15960 [Deinococcus ficus]|nr:hypothetical protein GCM10017782_15960 [Deinococcus ficus]